MSSFYCGCRSCVANYTKRLREVVSQLTIAEPSHSNTNQPATIVEKLSSARASIETSPHFPRSPQSHPSQHAPVDAPLIDLQGSVYPASYTYDKIYAGRVREAVMQRMMELESAWETIGLNSRPRVIIGEGGQRFLLQRQSSIQHRGEKVTRSTCAPRRQSKSICGT